MAPNMEETPNTDEVVEEVVPGEAAWWPAPVPLPSMRLPRMDGTMWVRRPSSPLAGMIRHLCRPRVP